MSRSNEPPRRSGEVPKKLELSRPRQALLSLMQNVNFGQIHDLVVENAEPVLQPPPRITREHKFRGENGPRSERSARDFQLKSQVVELFAVFDTIQNATIGVLEVRHGLPFRMIITEDPGKPAA